MKTRFVIPAVVTSAVVLVTVTSLLAQRPAQPEWTQAKTALVDIRSLTQNHGRLNQALERLKKKYEAEAATLKAESERGNQLAEQLRKLSPDSAQHKKLERQIAKLRADFELHGKRASGKIEDQEAALYYAFSRELAAELRRFAQATGTQLVLRYEPPSLELTDPRLTVREIGRLVVYQRGLEVTPLVQDGMQRRAGASANRPAAQPAQPAGVPR